jgi:subtilisin-like proprotein convertase family protein
MMTLNNYQQTKFSYRISWQTKKKILKRQVAGILFSALLICISSVYVYSQCTVQPLINFPMNGNTNSIITSGSGVAASTAATFNAANGIATTGGAFFSNPTAGGSVQIAANALLGGSVNIDFAISGANLSLFKTFSIYYQTQRQNGSNATLTMSYSKNGAGFNSFTGSASSVTTTYTAVTATLPVGADNPTSLTIRLTAAFPILGGGTFRVDNFQVQGLPVAPAAPATTGTSICTGNTATISASFNASPAFNWFPVSSGGSSLSTNTSYNPVNGDPTVPNPYDNNIPGVYTYYAQTSLLGCPSTRTPATVTVGVPVTVNPSSVPNPICAGLNAAVNANIANGSAPFTISWTPSTFLSSTTSATPTAIGITTTTTYTVNVTDGCGNTASGSVTINVNQLPPVSITTVPSPPVICVTGSVSLSACCANTYSWAPATSLNATTGATVISSTTSTRTYTVTGTDANGCSATSSVQVIFSPAINPTSGSNTPFCPGGNINLTSGPNGMSYQWSGPNGFTSSLQNPVVSGAGAADAGTYTVVVTNVNNCSASSSTVVLMSSPVVTANIVSTVPSPLCAQGNANLNANPVNGKSPYTYSWFPATFLNSTTSKTPVATNINTTTTYTVTITDACGLTATAPLTVTILNNPTVSVSTPSNHICAPSGTSLNASGDASTYSWTPSTGLASTAGATVIASPPSPTTYTVTGTGANGCTSTQSISITVSPALNVTTTATPSVICPNSNSQLLSTVTNNYTVSSVPFSFATPVSPVTVSLGNDAMSAAVPLPFSFNFYGTSMTQLFIGSNGFLQLGSSSATTGIYGQTLPTTASPNNIIAGAWTNLNPSGGGTVSYFVTGSLPNRIFIVQFNNVQMVGVLGLNGTCTFQIKLYETTNIIEVHLQTVDQPLLSLAGPTTVALKNADGSLFIGVPGRFNNGNWEVSTAEAWRFNAPPAINSILWTPATFLTSTSISNPVAQNVTASTVYTVTASDVTGCSATKTVGISLSSPLVTVTSASPVGCVGQPVTLTATALGGFTNLVSAANNSPSSISSSGTPTVTSTITMGAGKMEAAADLTVTINLTHSFAGDVKVTLSGPCGSTVLFDRLGVPLSPNGNNNAFGGQYVFKVSAASVLSESGALPAGTYRPSDVNGNAHNFAGLTFPCNNIAGIWTLTIQDLATGDGGTLNSWSMDVVQQHYTSIFSGPATIGSVIASGTYGSISNVPVSPVAAGNNTYTVTTTDITGCSTTSSVTVNANSLPVPYVSPGDTSLCTGTIIIIKAKDASVYSGGWPAGTSFDFGFGPTSDSTFMVNGPGVYNVNVILPGNMGGCSVISPDADIAFRDAPVLDANTSPASCFGSSNGSVTSHILLGTPPFRYKYYNSAGNIVRDITHSSFFDTLANVASGQYQLVVYDTAGVVYPPPSCASDSIILIVAQPAILVATETHTPILCHGNTSTVTISATGGTLNYSGTGVFTQQGGVHQYTVTDANGCSSTATASILEPDSLTLDVTTAYPPCLYTSANLASTVTGGTIPYHYAWSNGASLANINGVSSDTYILTVTDDAGCSISKPVVIATPGPVTVTGIATNLLCRGVSTGAISPAVSGGFGPYSYLWNGGVISQNRTGLPAGTYTVTVTDVNSCTKTKTYTITQPATTMVINSNKTNVRCYGLNSGSATASPAGGTAPYTYSWNTLPVKTTATATGLYAGVYTCTVTDAIGCAKNLLITITEPPDLTLFQTQTNVTFPGGNNGTALVVAGGGTPGYLYSWNTNPVKTTSTVTGLTAGTYKCTVTDTKSCTAKASFIITEPIAKGGNATYAEDWMVTATPNPSSGLVTMNFEADGVEMVNVSLSDYTGRIIYQNETKPIAGLNEIVYDFSSYAKGIYIINLMSGSKTKFIRLVIQ